MKSIGIDTVQAGAFPHNTSPPKIQGVFVDVSVGDCVGVAVGDGQAEVAGELTDTLRGDSLLEEIGDVGVA